eukprot:451834-Rhodomonas_salina.2
MINDERQALLLTSFEARVLAETDEERDAQWETMKQNWSNSENRQHPQQLSLSSIFDRVEAVLNSRKMAQTSNELLEKQIYEVLGPQSANPNQLPWMRNGAPAVNLACCTQAPLDLIRAHSGAPRKKLLRAMTNRPRWFQVEALELLFEGDRRDGIPINQDSLALYDYLLRNSPGTLCCNCPARAPKVQPYLMVQDEEQQEPVCVGMASLSLGPALKAQFAASSKRFTSLGDGCARDNLIAKPSMDEDESRDNHHGNDDLPTQLTL